MPYDYLCRNAITKAVCGIEFYVYASESEISIIEKKLYTIGNAIASGNKQIKDEQFKVRKCIITKATTTRYAMYEGHPVIAIRLPEATGETAFHEMGHAIFEQYRKTAGQSGSITKDIGYIISDIFLRLEEDTKKVDEYERDSDGNREIKRHPAGLWMVDPSQWSKTLASEHPWSDVDEFFASARKAYLLDRQGLMRAIDKFTRLDSNVKAPAKQLVDVLSALERGKIPSTKAISQGAREHISKDISEPGTTGSNVQEMKALDLKSYGGELQVSQ